jgi:putative transposase
MVSFKGRQFDKMVILMAVRWYIAYPLSYKEVNELLLERGIKVPRSTIYRWVVAYAPQLEAEFRKRHKRIVGKSWRMDETYIKVKGVWHYLYRAVDSAGDTVDFYLSKNRDKKSAQTFFNKAIESNGIPEKVTIDGSSANLSALNVYQLYLIALSLMGYCDLTFQIRQIKYLNNIVEQDHRGIKRITKTTTGFKAFESAKATLAGIELHRMLRKEQHKESANRSIFDQFYSLAG